MSKRLWNNSKNGLDEFYQPDDFWKVKFENLFAHIIGYVFWIIVGLLVMFFMY